MFGLQDSAIALQTLVAGSVFFVWVVRYPNIVVEFERWGFPDWFRDALGIVKLTLAMMLLIGINRHQFSILGGIGLGLLMLAALATHFWFKTPIIKRLPSLTLLALSIGIVGINLLLQRP